MRFTIAREKLQEALTSVAPAVPAKTTLPVLANILVEASERGVRFSGTDLDVAVSVEVPADVEMPGALTLPAKRLGEITRELPPAPVKIAALGEQRATLECGRTKFKLLGLPRDEYPAFAPVEYNTGWRVKSSVLHELISRTAFAVSTEESRPILNGVLWEVRPQLLRMVGVDSETCVVGPSPTAAADGGDQPAPARAGGVDRRDAEECARRLHRSAARARSGAPRLSARSRNRNRKGRKPSRVPQSA